MPHRHLETWPQTPLNRQPVGHLPFTVDASGWLIFPDGWEPTFQQLPPELFLRELPQLDLDDEHGVAQFMRTYGVISTRYPSRGITPDGGPRRAPGSNALTHMKDVRAFLLTARAATFHVLAVQRAENRLEPWQNAGFRLHDPDDADRWFARVVSLGLRPFSPRVVYRHDEPHPRDPARLLDDELSLLDYGLPRPDLYEGLCLDIYNLIIDDLPIKICANARCRNYFVRHAGRSQHGQNRLVGVQFCSSLCAKAEGERRRRQSKRSAQ